MPEGSFVLQSEAYGLLYSICRANEGKLSGIISKRLNDPPDLERILHDQ